MSKKARTPIIEHDDYLAIELPGDRSPQERDRLSDQAMVVAYDRLPRRQARWRLRALHFDREEWTRSGIRRWWAAHEVWFLAPDQLERPIPEICRSYDSPGAGLPAIFLCHRNTPMLPARQQVQALSKRPKGAPKHGSPAER
jgi:hypothetical protein